MEYNEAIVFNVQERFYVQLFQYNLTDGNIQHNLLSNSNTS